MTGGGGPLGDVMTRRRAVPPEVRLFQAKILQHVQDACSSSGKPEGRYWREYGRRWLAPGSEQFEAFCLGAGWDPGRVAAGVLTLDRKAFKKCGGFRKRKP